MTPRSIEPRISSRAISLGGIEADGDVGVALEGAGIGAGAAGAGDGDAGLGEELAGQLFEAAL